LDHVKKAEEVLDTCKRKILRRIYCPLEDDKVWRIIYNTEIYYLWKDMKVTAFSKYRRLLEVGMGMQSEWTNIVCQRKPCSK